MTAAYSTGLDTLKLQKIKIRQDQDHENLDPYSSASALCDDQHVLFPQTSISESVLFVKFCSPFEKRVLYSNQSNTLSIKQNNTSGNDF